MSKRIFKYHLKMTGVQQVEMPQDAEILCFQIQHDIGCIWALVEPDKTGIKRTFEIFVTGQILPKNGNRKYIGTCQVLSGDLVFHCFELLSLS